jgi:cytochrome c
MSTAARHRGKRATVQAIAAATFLMVACASAGAQNLEGPSPDKGHAFAQKLCRNCHVVGDDAAASVPAGVPSFRAIANRPDQTAERIRNVLINPHPPMPDVQISNEEIANILAYLDTLRTDKSKPPLSPAQQAPKPKYPEPS